MSLKQRTDRWKEIDRETKKDVEKVKKAKTAEEVDDGIDSASDRF